MAARLTNTAIVVLGLVAAGARNGYEIAQTVERATRYFWTASPGGIYPELRRLRGAGLLDVNDDARGEAARHSYTITAAGREALRDWLLDPAEGRLEMRHEDLLRLFLAAELEREDQLTILRRIRAGHERRAEELETVTRAFAGPDPEPPKSIVLEYGIALHRGAAEWCARAESQLGG